MILEPYFFCGAQQIAFSRFGVIEYDEDITGDSGLLLFRYVGGAAR